MLLGCGAHPACKLILELFLPCTADPACAGSVQSVQIRGRDRSFFFITDAGPSAIFKLTALGWNSSRALGADICFTLGGACPTIDQFCFNEGSCRWACITAAWTRSQQQYNPMYYTLRCIPGHADVPACLQTGIYTNLTHQHSLQGTGVKRIIVHVCMAAGSPCLLQTSCPR